MTDHFASCSSVIEVLRIGRTSLSLAVDVARNSIGVGFIDPLTSQDAAPVAANADTIESLDLNPFLVRPSGEGALALDAVLVTRPPTP